MFSVYCTSKWIHCAWIFSWVVQFHKSFVKKCIGLEVYVALWCLFGRCRLKSNLFCVLKLFLFSFTASSPFFIFFSICISDLFHTTHQTKGEYSLSQIQGEGFRALPGLNIFFPLILHFSCLFTVQTSMANSCLLSYFFHLYFTMKLVSYLPWYLRASNEVRRYAVMHVWLQGHFISAAVQSQPGLHQTIWKRF